MREAELFDLRFHLFTESTVADDAEGHVGGEFAPGVYEDAHPFLLAETPYKESVFSRACFLAGIRVHEVWLDDDAVAGETALHKFELGEFRERDVDIDFFVPRAHGAMGGEHGGQRGGLGRALTVATAKNSRPGKRPSEAGFANSSFAHQSGGGAEEPVIVQGLHDGNTGFGACVVNGRRNQRKRIVEVGDVGLGLGH